MDPTTNTEAEPAALPPETAAEVWGALTPVADQPAVEEPASVPAVATGGHTTETPKDERRGMVEPAKPKPDANVTHLKDIEQAERDVARAEMNLLEAKEHAKLAKDMFDTAVSRLRKTIRQDDAPLFDNVAAEPASVAATTPVETPDPDAWKVVPVSQIVTDEKLVAMLVENSITTFEQLEAWRASRFETPKIKGLGDVKRQAIEDAIVAWWTMHPPVKAVEVIDPAGKLRWLSSDNDEQLDANTFAADNTAGILNDEGLPCQFTVILEEEDGTATIDMSAAELLPSLQSTTFPSVSEAMDWCEARNAELVAERAADAKPAEQPTYGPGSLFIGQSGKNWMIAINTHEAADGTHGVAWDIRLGEVTNESPLAGNHPSQYAARIWAIGDVRAFIAGKVEALDVVGTRAAKAVAKALEKGLESLKSEAQAA